MPPLTNSRTLDQAKKSVNKRKQLLLTLVGLVGVTVFLLGVVDGQLGLDVVVGVQLMLRSRYPFLVSP